MLKCEEMNQDEHEEEEEEEEENWEEKDWEEYDDSGVDTPEGFDTDGSRPA